MINNRNYFRLHKVISCFWSVPQQKVEGKGKILNISLSGMSFETDKLFHPEHGLNISFSSAEIDCLPSAGTLVWFNKVGEAENHYHCGIKFLKEYAFNKEWISWMNGNIQKLGNAGDNKILGHYLTGGD